VRALTSSTAVCPADTVQSISSGTDAGPGSVAVIFMAKRGKRVRK